MIPEVGIFIYVRPKAGYVKKTNYKYILTAVGKTKTVTGSGELVNTTSNRAHLKAAIEALKHMNRASVITIHTESDYLVNGHKNLPEWISNGWIRNNGMQLKNSDLWKELRELESSHGIRCIKDTLINTMFEEKE